MRRIALIAAAVALVVTACTGDDDDATPSTTSEPSEPTVITTDDAEPAASTFTFGVLAPGDAALDELAIGQQRGLTVALDDINAAGGVLGGSVTTVQAEESVDEPIATTLEALAAEADAIVGPVSSATAVEVAALARDQQLLVCSASATASSVTDDGVAASFFRTAMRDDDTAAAVADRVMDVDGDDPPPGTVMIVGRDDVYGTELAGELSAELNARGANVDTLLYPARRVDFEEEIATITAADPDVVVLAAFAEGITLVQQLAAAGYPAARIVGLDGMSRPDIAEQLFPDDPAAADGFRVIRSTGDRLVTERLLEVPGEDGQTAFGAQMYDCAVTIALAAIAASSTDPVAVGAEVRAVTNGGRTCSTFAHCKALLDAGEGIAYAGTSGGLGIDAEGDISTARLVTSTVVEGLLLETASDKIDLVALRHAHLLSAAMVTTQLQQALKALGYFDGDVTGYFDAETADALRALQADLGVPVTGEYDEATDEALRARLGAASATLTHSTAQLQLELQALGYYDGPIDGRYSAATIAAVRAFQARIGVPQTGVVDTTTLRQIYVLGQQNPLQPPPPPPPAPDTTQPPPPDTTQPPPPPPVTAPPPPPVTDPPPPPVIDPPPPPVTDPPPPPPTEPPPPPPPPPPTPAPTTTEPPTTTTTEPPAPELATMYEALAADPRFSTFVGLLRDAGFSRDLSIPAPGFTVFAPTNDAFDRMDADERAAWTSDPAQLRALLAYHGVDPDAGVLAPGDFRTGPLRSIHGAELDVDVAGTTVTVNTGRLGTPLEASNGAPYPIDIVLVPPD